jgi:hypothetical protein
MALRRGLGLSSGRLDLVASGKVDGVRGAVPPPDAAAPHRPGLAFVRLAHQGYRLLQVERGVLDVLPDSGSVGPALFDHRHVGQDSRPKGDAVGRVGAMVW